MGRGETDGRETMDDGRKSFFVYRPSEQSERSSVVHRALDGRSSIAHRPINSMPKLIVTTNNNGVREIPFSPGSSVRAILDASGVTVRSGCSGNGACGLCLVRVESGDANTPTKNERLLLTSEQLGQNNRLACQLRPKTDLVVRIINIPSADGRKLNGVHYDQPQMFDAFIKSVQYLVRLKTQQDVWDHLGKFIMTYFPAVWTAFAERDAAQGISVRRCSLPGETAVRQLLTDAVRTVVADVLDSGFLASHVVLTPAPSMTAFLPIVEEYHTKKVMLIGHKDTGPIPNELLNIYLALAGLAGTTFERLQAEHELNKHRAHLEELVKEQTAGLEAANRELEAFSYSVSHDLRAPLRSIDGFSRLLMEEYEDKLDDDGKDHLRRMRAAAGKMAQLIDALLDLSRLTRAELKRVKTDLSSLAHGAVDELRRSEPGRRVVFVAAEGVTAEGDPAMLRAVFENLIGNAWKFTAKTENAQIEFGVMSSEIGDRSRKTPDSQLPTPNSQLVYFVRDNGAGFDPAFAHQLFAAFQRLHGNSEFPGIGIGLATVQRIVHRHGGSIWAEGGVGKGATFFFTL
jgi:signal transduction histidine kinase/ferredoxin